MNTGLSWLLFNAGNYRGQRAAFDTFRTVELLQSGHKLQQSFLLQQRLKLINRYRFAEQIPLVVSAVVFQKELSLLFRLHSFGNDGHVQTSCHGNDGAHNCDIAAICDNIAYE